MLITLVRVNALTGTFILYVTVTEHPLTLAARRNNSDVCPIHFPCWTPGGSWAGHSVIKLH